MEENLQNVPADEAKELAEQARIRREKLQKLVAEGNNPFVKVNYEVTANSAYIVEHFAELEGKEVSIAGRLMSRRIMGKASFSHIQDRNGQLQIYVRRDDVGEEDYAAFKKDYDLGDRVTCVNKRWGIKINVRITEVSETYQQNIEEIDITFGESLPALLTQIRQIAK